MSRTQARRRARIERGSTSRRTLRALHNDFDDACDYWFGDRRPEANDTTNRDFGGASTPTTDLRCLMCRPYTDTEDQHLTAPDLPTLTGLAAAGVSVRRETMTS